MTRFKSGIIAIMGPPNVGKSTLMNRLLGTKVSIVSPKPQTTRNRIVGIKTTDEFQMVFIDTPGLNRFPKKLNQVMNREAVAAAEGVDVVLFLSDVGLMTRDGSPEIPPICVQLKIPVVLAVNKIDVIPRPEVLPLLETASKVEGVKEVIPISALKGINLDRLTEILISLIPDGPLLYPPDQVTDAPFRFLAAETIREKVFHLCKEEIPYGVAVIIEDIETEEDRDLMVIYAVIVTERQSQKGILIGKGGRMIREIGTMARRELQQTTGRKIFLELQVKVEPNWTRDDNRIGRFGMYHQE